MSTAKEEARKLIDGLPDDATWEDVQHQVELRQKIEEARQQIASGESFSTEEVKARLGEWLES
jgi:hypothetical protein